MAWVTSKGPPKEAETIAGLVKITSEERPLVHITKHLFRESVRTDWERKERNYHVFLTRPGSSEEKEIGHAGVVYRKVSDIQYLKMHAIFTNAGLKEDDKIAMINTFYPIPFEEKDTPTGKKLVPSGEISQKGIGRAVMNEVLERCKSEGAAAVYCCTTKPTMQILLGKFEFQKTEYFYLKTFEN